MCISVPFRAEGKIQLQRTIAQHRRGSASPFSDGYGEITDMQVTRTELYRLEKALSQQNANADLLAVGAVYDRAVFAVEWDERLVIARAYSRKWQRTFDLRFGST